MKAIRDTERLQRHLEQYKIREYFDTPNLQFQLFEYEKGEVVIRPTQPLDYILFIVVGGVKIYAIRTDGTQNAISITSGFIVLGEMEFLTDSVPIFFAEAMTSIVCVAVSLQNHREELMNDLRFFRLLAKGLAEKFQLITQQETISTNLEEKVLNYIRFHCPNQTIAHMEHTAFQLHCSRRQLQRVVKKLTDCGLLYKTGKGRYRLVDSSSAQIPPPTQ